MVSPSKLRQRYLRHFLCAQVTSPSGWRSHTFSVAAVVAVVAVAAVVAVVACLRHVPRKAFRRGI